MKERAPLGTTIIIGSSFNLNNTVSLLEYEHLHGGVWVLASKQGENPTVQPVKAHGV